MNTRYESLFWESLHGSIYLNICEPQRVDLVSYYRFADGKPATDITREELDALNAAMDVAQAAFVRSRTPESLLSEQDHDLRAALGRSSRCAGTLYLLDTHQVAHALHKEMKDGALVFLPERKELRECVAAILAGRQKQPQRAGGAYRPAPVSPAEVLYGNTPRNTPGMTRPFHRGSSLRRTLVMLGLAIGLAGCSEASEQRKKDSQMTQLEMTLWQTIDALIQQTPFTRATVENVLKITLAASDPSHYAIQPSSFQPLDGGPVKLSDGVVIGNVDLRISHKEGRPGFLVLNLTGACVGLDAVRAHYGDLRITDFPRGRSPNEVTSHTAVLQWGELSFSFKEHNPDCLSSIAFDPRPLEASNAAE